jgi:hypothetical protein
MRCEFSTAEKITSQKSCVRASKYSRIVTNSLNCLHSRSSVQGLLDTSYEDLPTRAAILETSSAQQDILSAALEASKNSMNRLQAIQAEVERAIERERMQVERLEFSLDKCVRDEAYYRSLRKLLEEKENQKE